MPVTNPLPEFLSRLNGVVERGEGYRALCPCHDDHDPSLDIDFSEDGNLLVLCRACGANGAAVADAIGLQRSDLFATSNDSNPAAILKVDTRPKQVSLGPETARYHYHDADGNRVMDAVRSGDGAGKTCWVALPDKSSGGIAGVQPPLYRLPQVIEGIRSGRWIIKTEGEKDSDRLSAEFCATTNPMGGGRGKWKRSHTESLRGAKVAILVDNDDTGIAHGEEVARGLHGVATLVKVILLPGLPPKGDVSDWLDQGHTTDELKEIIETAAEWQPSDSPEPDESVLQAVQRSSESRIEWDGFFEKERSDENWLVPPLIPEDRQVVIYSRAKQGKSLLSLEIGAALATGKAVLGRDAGEPKRVLYVDMEMTEDDLWERLRDLGYTEEDEPLLQENLAYYQLPTLPPLDTEHGGKVLLQLALDHRADLVVIDTMSRVVQGEENQNDTWQDFYTHTGRLLKQHGITLLRLDHSGKDGRKGQRGGSAKYDDPDVVFELTHNSPRVTLKTKGVSRVSWVPAQVNLVRQEDPLRHVWKQDAYTDRERALADLLDQLDLPTGMGKRKAKAAVDEMIEKGQLDQDQEAIATASSTTWTNAIRLRKSRTSAGTTPRTDTAEPPRTTPGTTGQESLHSKAGTTSGTTENHSQPGVGTGSRLLGGNRFPPPPAAAPPPTPGDRPPDTTTPSSAPPRSPPMTWSEYAAKVGDYSPTSPN